MAIEDVLARVDKKTRSRIMKASDINIVRYPWASVGLTAATGGLARGRVHLLYGNKSTGKSLLAMQTIGDLMREHDLTAAVIDSEGTTDPDFVRKLGVDPDRLLVTHDKSFLGAGESAKDLLKSGIDILLVDSTSTLIPEAFLEKDEIKSADGQKQIGARAKATGILMNTIHYSNDNDAIIIVVSQARMAIGAMHASLTFEGGKAMEHAASQIIRLTSPAGESQQIKGEVHVGDKIFQRPIGREVNLFVEKNKLGPAAGTPKYNMYYSGESIGIDTYEETVRLGVEYGVVERAGAWYKYGGMQWQGSDAMGKAFREDEILFNEVKKLTVEAMSGE